MSEQVSATHGPVEDEHIKRQDRTELQEHGEEWPDRAESDEGSDEGSWAPEARFASTPDGPDFQAIELRSELARHLDRTTFPATREQLLRALLDRQAEQPLLDGGVIFGHIALHIHLNHVVFVKAKRPAFNVLNLLVNNYRADDEDDRNRKLHHHQALPYKP